MPSEKQISLLSHKLNNHLDDVIEKTLLKFERDIQLGGIASTLEDRMEK